MQPNMSWGAWHVKASQMCIVFSFVSFMKTGTLIYWCFWLSSGMKLAHTCYSLSQEPFKSLPVIWTIHEKMLALRLRKYTSNGQVQLMSDWKRIFNRATVIVFPNYVLPVIFSILFTHSHFVCKLRTSWSLSFRAGFNLCLDTHLCGCQCSLFGAPSDLI